LPFLTWTMQREPLAATGLNFLDATVRFGGQRL
jgi:hypothetical protein